ncbi:7391_t:CDS:1, partial [Racocetra persica]
MSSYKEIEDTIKTLPEFYKLESKTFLSLKKLIIPNIRKNKFNPPRAQNCFMIFRKDFTAYYNSLNQKGDIDKVSILA